MTKTVLGLDLGTNSIGWALIEINHERKILKIIALGSRVIPMDSQEFSKFNAGDKIKSAANNRTEKHRARITKERYLLRRDRLHLVLNLLEALPNHYKIEIDFERNGEKCGQFKEETEPKIAYLPSKNNEDKFEFYYEDAFNEMIADLQKVNPEIKNEKGKRVPKDWTIYFLRNKALSEKISLEELAWVLLSYNQKRGTELIEVEDENQKSDELKELLDLKVTNVETKSDKQGNYFEITLNDSNNFKYKEYTNEQLTFIDDIKEVLVISKLDEAGNILNENTIYQISDLYELNLEAIKHRQIENSKFKHAYDFIYSNGWHKERGKEKTSKAYFATNKKIEEDKKPKIDLYVVSNKYNCKGNPESIIPKIELPDFSSDGSKDWTLLKKKTEKDIIKFNISKGYIKADGSSKNFISPKIYDTLISDVKLGERTKIIGGLFQTIDRKFYREELYEIINTQRKFHTDLNEKSILEKCIKLLYPNNEEHSKQLLENKKAISNLLIEDILLYQRPLKSKKSEITDCKFEIDYWKNDVNKTTGKKTEIPIYKKAVSASHPLFQEFRIWDKIHNLKIIQLEGKDENGKSETNVDITSQYFKPKDYTALFTHFNTRVSVTLDSFLEFCKKRFNLEIGKKDDRKILWNYPVDEEFKGNETRKSFEIRFKRCGFKDIDFQNFMTQQKEIELWHYLYSVSISERKKVSQIKDTNNPKYNKTSIQNFFKTFFKEYKIDDEVVEKLSKDFEAYPKFNSKYCSFSAKALSKLLSVMRIEENFLNNLESDNSFKNKYKKRATEILNKINTINWSEKNIDFSKIIVNDIDRKKGKIPFPKGLFNTFKNFNSVDDFKFLNLTQASYFIYGRHSELAQAKYWNAPEKIREEINKELKHNSLNNPVAEKVLKETMKMVADIWEYYGHSEEKYFTKIHLEVARELQKTNKEKQEISKNQKTGRNENDRLRSILEEFLNNPTYKAIKGNQDHFERLKIVEDGAKTTSSFDKSFYENNKEKFNKKEIEDILKKSKISNSEFEKYKLWIEQGYKSPYTNMPIKLSDLFDGNKYNIDHIFPSALVTNDSFNNKVVCEKEINKEKSAQTGRAFILSNQGNKINTVARGDVKIISDIEYVELVKNQFRDAKRFIMLAIEVPSGFTDSQLNNTKYIARKAMELLSHIVREDGEIEFRSKNVLPVTGAITDLLKKEWKLNQVWTELLTPRFERLNKMYNSDEFGTYQLSKSGHQYFDINTKYILERNEKFELKRLDHRHHALDALIIALCTENHVQYINNINSGITNNKKEKMGAILAHRAGIKRQIMFNEIDKNNPKEKIWKYMLPGSFRLKGPESKGKDSVVDMLWTNKYSEKLDNNFKNVILVSLEHCIVTFKNDFKLVSKSSNKYESYKDENGKLRIDGNGKPMKGFISQKNENQKHWSIRKPLHSDNPSSRIKTGIINKIWYKSLDNLNDIIDNEFRNNAIDIVRKLDKNEEIEILIESKYREARKLLEMILKNQKLINKEKNLSKRDEIECANQKLKLTFEKEYKPFLLLKNERITDKIEFNEIKYRKYQPILDLADRKSQSKKIVSYEAMIKKLNKIYDEVLKNELIKHLEDCGNDIDIAFSLDGINEFNNNRGKQGKNPLKKIPISEGGSAKFAIGNKKTNDHQWVETGGNFHFKITIANGERNFETITLRDSIKLEKEKILNHIKKIEIHESGFIILSPNDLVFVPTPEEIEKPSLVDIKNLTKEQVNRIYVVNDFSTAIYFTPNRHSKAICPKEIDMEFDKKKNQIVGSFDDKTARFNGNQIKNICWKLEIDRLGNIKKVIR